MAGHSKWKNIQHRKNAQDAKKGKIFQKLSKEIYVAAKSGDINPDNNPTLRMVIEKAKANSMPKDNIQKAIEKAKGGKDTANYEEVVYEAYGPEGTALIINTLTDNRNRTNSNVKNIINKNGGKPAEMGSVQYMFKRAGVLILNNDFFEEELIEIVIKSGAYDFISQDDIYIIYTEPNDFEDCKKAIDKKYGEINYIQCEITLVPTIEVEASGETNNIIEKLVDALEDDDDVQEVIHNLK